MSIESRLPRVFAAIPVALLMLAVAGVAGAEGDRKSVSDQFKKNLDTNGDGVVSEEEVVAAREAFRLKRFDKNGDGVLDEKERATANKRQAERIAAFDKDGDGKLSPEEREAMRDARTHSGLDLNGDGKISPGERAEFRKRREERLEALTEKYDADGDGTLSRAEREAAIKAGEEIGPGALTPEERAARRAAKSDKSGALGQPESAAPSDD